MLTMVSAPKSFSDARVATLQMNALSSWSRLAGVEILLLGEDQGIAQAAASVGAQHIRGVRCNEAGTPLISSMIDLARQAGSGKLLCIINADMIVMHDLLHAAREVSARAKRFVLLARRWDLDIDLPLEFSTGWEERFRHRARQDGVLHRPAGSDFFVFPRHLYADVPDFAVGRAGWDNWMIYKARRERWSVVDCTDSVMIVHQNHDYSHLPGGAPHYDLPESDKNIQLAGGHAAIRYTILDATHRLTAGGLRRPRFTYHHFMRRVELTLRALFFFLPPRMIEEVSRPKRWRKRLGRILGQGKIQGSSSQR